MAGGLNLYGFAGGDPVNYSDPHGENPILIGLVAAHYLRNLLNKGERIRNEQAAADSGFSPRTAKESTLHQFGEGNEDNRVWEDESGHHEVVIGADQQRVTDGRNRGSYNYCPKRWLAGAIHAVCDVAPYAVLGNTPSDLFNLGARIKRMIDFFARPEN